MILSKKIKMIIIIIRKTGNARVFMFLAGLIIEVGEEGEYSVENPFLPPLAKYFWK